MEYLEYLFGGLFYTLSPAFRRRKRRQWAEKSRMYRIYEIGMWVTFPLVTLILVAIYLVQP